MYKNIKSLTRQRIKDERKDFNADLYANANDKIYRSVIDIITSLKPRGYIGTYWPLIAEPDLSKLMILFAHNICMPVVNANHMFFVKYKLGDNIESNNIIPNLYQPIAKAEVVPEVIILPGLAFTANGHRLGFGRGYYDLYLHQNSKNIGATIGVSFHRWLVEFIDFDDSDYRLDYVVTDQHIIVI